MFLTYNMAGNDRCDGRPDIIVRRADVRSSIWKTFSLNLILFENLECHFDPF